MDNEIFPVFSALWLGILTSISPCPLATNIAATTYIGKQMKKRSDVLLAGVSYTIGRSITYMILCIILVSGLLSIPAMSNFLQKYMNIILGPVLIVAGLFILEYFSFTFYSLGIADKLQKRFNINGISGACVLGVLFALSFCPISAALFFGSVIPFALKFESNISLPVFYGAGTSIPVLISAIILAYASHIAGKFFNRLIAIEKWLRKISGAIFIFIGIYFCFKYIFGIINF